MSKEDTIPEDHEEGRGLLSSDLTHATKSPSKTYPGRSHTLSTTLLLSIIAASLLIGAALGSGLSLLLSTASTRQPSNDDIPRFPGNSSMTFEIDTGFIGPPREEFEERWRSIMPAGRGFLSHPSLQPQVKAFSVFHQLHCLYSLTIAFWAVAGGAPLNETHHGQPLNIHFGHCTEFLRQALMCHADVNLEDVPDVQHGASGWGFPRVCRDFSQVASFAERWAYGNGTGIG